MFLQLCAAESEFVHAERSQFNFLTKTFAASKGTETHSQSRGGEVSFELLLLSNTTHMLYLLMAVLTPSEGTGERNLQESEDEEDGSVTRLTFKETSLHPFYSPAVKRSN